MADELKVLVGEDEDTHSFNAIGMNQYLASVRGKHVLKSKSDPKVGIVGGNPERFSTAISRRYDRRREHGRSAAAGAL